MNLIRFHRLINPKRAAETVPWRELDPAKKTIAKNCTRGFPMGSSTHSGFGQRVEVPIVMTSIALQCTGTER